MKKLFCVLAVLGLFVFSGMACAEKISWVNPTAYSDGSVISTADKSTIQTVISVKGATETEYVALSTVKYGYTSYTGLFPAAYTPGTAINVKLTSKLYGLDSEPTVVDYTIPTIPPSSPTDVTIIR